MLQIISIILNIILVCAVAIIALKNNGKLNGIDLIDEKTIKSIYEMITDTIELSDVITNTYDEYKDYNIFVVFTNMVRELELIKDNSVSDALKVALYKKLIEIFDDTEIEQRLQERFEELKLKDAEKEMQDYVDKKDDVPEVQSNSPTTTIFDKF